MTLPPRIDASLAAIRAAGELLDGRHRRELEQARYHLWRALDTGDGDAARAWLRTLWVLLAGLPESVAPLVAAAIEDLAAHLAETRTRP